MMLTILAESALRLVMLAISSSEALVSSREAACALELSARVWLEELTWTASACTSSPSGWPPGIVCATCRKNSSMYCSESGSYCDG